MSPSCDPCRLQLDNIFLLFVWCRENKMKLCYVASMEKTAAPLREHTLRKDQRGRRCSLVVASSYIITKTCFYTSTPLRFIRSTWDKIYLPNYNHSTKHARPLGGDKLYARYHENSLSMQIMFLICSQKTNFWATKSKVTSPCIKYALSFASTWKHRNQSFQSFRCQSSVDFITEIWLVPLGSLP